MHVPVNQLPVQMSMGREECVFWCMGCNKSLGKAQAGALSSEGLARPILCCVCYLVTSC